MTQADIERIKAYCAKARKGPWYVGVQNDGLYVIDGPPSPAPYDGPIPRPYGPEVVATPNWRLPSYEADANFIAQARADTPLLVEALEQLQKERDDLKREVAELKESDAENIKDILFLEDALIGNADFGTTGLVDRKTRLKERIRDLIAAEGEAGDLRDDIQSALGLCDYTQLSLTGKAVYERIAARTKEGLE